MSEQEIKVIMTRGEVGVLVSVLGALSPMMANFGDEIWEKVINGIRKKLEKHLN